MTPEAFENILSERLAAIETVATSKGKEYSRGDRFCQFKEAGAMMGLPPEMALLGMMIKHWTSVVYLIRDIQTDKVASLDVWAEKTGDMIVYLILLYGLIVEREAINAPINGGKR